MVRGFVAGILASVIGLAVYLTFHLGLFEPVQISQENREAFRIFFRSHTGAYFEIASIIDDVERIARDHGISCSRTFGEYLDDPKIVDQDRLRSRGGCIVDERDSLPSGLEQDEIKSDRYVVAHFSGSPAVGPWKVYPRVFEFMNSSKLEASGPTIEIYTLKSNSIATEYLFPVRPLTGGQTTAQ